MSKEDMEAKRIVDEKRKKEQSALDELRTGTKYLTLQKRGKTYKTRLNNGHVVDKIYGVEQGWPIEKLLDWADRGGVRVFVSDTGRSMGKGLATRLLEASA